MKCANPGVVAGPAALSALAALALLAGAAPARAAETTVGISHGIDKLTGPRADWHETALTLRHQLAPRSGFGLGATRIERFGIHETQFSANADLPLSERLTASIDGTASGDHQILARHALGATLQYEFAKGWLVHGGGRSSSYNDAHVNQSLLMLERYVGNYSFAGAWRAARALGATAHSGELRANYYYGERSAVGLSLAAGKEAANIGGVTRLGSVRSAALTGRHWLDQRWAVTYALGHTRQGDFYTRNGINLGLQATY
ncbi:YaiO family outer membrane beta-barrel protein [Pseudoduganella sp. DS3]|uniref:YaiO family outer membrane beta-barrel protein n=1 Tax=Pseudoduganella guangdongensis TaxID=2692179 RepID=A0A6N9HNT3_9BURK|nr:YaiO family outer membrane beta-barrel protein [Pseudoduganella guangdongensis]MYN05144.1 YaiO family outer membrane beta-barrel protein [Pseudoduganella guangdongensis]